MMKKVIRKFFKGLGILLLVAAVVYFFGPTPDTPELDYTMPEVPAVADVAAFVADKEARTDSIKPGNAAEVVWAGAPGQKTPVSIVYLHGFSASHMEGAPIHTAFARRYGCNLYLSRLDQHGIASENALLNWTPEGIVASAKEALAIGMALGDSVIIMSCSTGGTLGLFLQAGDYPIKAHIAYSPNIRMAKPESYLLNKPWGLQISRMVFGSDFNCWSNDPETQKYWQTCYRLEAVVQLQELVEATMHEETFAAVKQPFFMGYYFKNDTLQDPVVSVDEMLWMYGHLGTPEAKKRSIPFPEAGAHVICSPIKSNTSEEVKQATFAFADEVLGMQPRN